MFYSEIEVMEIELANARTAWNNRAWVATSLVDVVTIAQDILAQPAVLDKMVQRGSVEMWMMRCAKAVQAGDTAMALYPAFTGDSHGSWNAAEAGYVPRAANVVVKSPSSGNVAISCDDQGDTGLIYDVWQVISDLPTYVGQMSLAVSVREALTPGAVGDKFFVSVRSGAAVSLPSVQVTVV